MAGRPGGGPEGRVVDAAADGVLCPPAVPLGTVVVPGDSDLELCRAHIERLQQVRGAGSLPWAAPAARGLLSASPGLCFSQQEPEGAGAGSPTCQKLSPKWCFLDGERLLVVSCPSLGVLGWGGSSPEPRQGPPPPSAS